MPAPPGNARDFIIYEAEAGETLEELARDHFLNPDDWRLVRAENRLASTRLVEGQRIRIDSSWLRRAPLEAEVLGFRGDVVVRRGETVLKLSRGLKLREGDRLELGPMGFLTIGLPDGSEAAFPTNSAVVIDRLRSYSLGSALDRRFRVERGSIESRVTPMKGPASRYEVTTPLSVAAVRGTQFRVTFTPGSGVQTSEVLEGRVGVRPGEKAETLVPADFGLVVTRAGAGRPERLLAPPVAHSMPMLHAGPEVRFAMRREAGAASYRADVATDARFLDRVLTAESSDGQFRLEGLAPGRYFLRVMAVSESGLVGRHAEFSFDRGLRSRALAAAPADPRGPGGDGVVALASAPASPGDASAADGSTSLAGGGGGLTMASVESEVEEGDTSEGVEAFVGTSSPAAGPWSAIGRLVAAGGGTGGGGGSGGGGGPGDGGGPGGGEGGGPLPIEPVLPSVPGGGAPGPIVTPDTVDQVRPLMPPLPEEPADEAEPDPADGALVTPLPDPLPPGASDGSVVEGGGPGGTDGSAGTPGTGPGSGPGPGVPSAAPVPEPATWLFLIGGFGLVGLVLRRRRLPLRA